MTPVAPVHDTTPWRDDEWRRHPGAASTPRPASGCGWYESSWELNRGLEVAEVGLDAFDLFTAEAAAA